MLKNSKSISYPIRINKYLALHNLATRRGADDLIRRKNVFINGKIAVLGDIVNEGDDVKIPRDIANRKYSYIAYNKPRGVITHSPQMNEKSIRDFLLNTHIFPMGRLDKDSEGLIILTDDGRITEKLLSPEYNHEKEYIVNIRTPLKPSFFKRMSEGVNIDGYRTKKCKISRINNFTFRIILTEGKKHQIRRMCGALGYAVADLKRIRIMNIRLGNLKPNKIRPIIGKELEEFLSLL
ncbi:MAG: Ribosomal large subunit pseudouridine synthase F [Parcubacteria group bacterium GW2011_GWC1_38_17]|nr:MAG: Ribosomal large subunit pseudouridine synthase F [Parcubacteria group bacterium GW2011_GWC2_36_17]KKQ43927.1 MAG: Ribosomal large subunit pseudouridine synthase F [Parcubacteria group bacterium GW2011_GWE2_37_8]KKQ59060.1 MAG: Ribosomal large subunit pseudouridine synthase F [Parcubacteria group bacterium GW2011_GWC1_38_17]